MQRGEITQNAFLGAELSGKHLYYIFYLIRCSNLFRGKVVEQLTMFIQFTVNKVLEILV
jgi:hypothetical protein